MARVKMFQDRKESHKDNRIENAHYIENMKVMEGWKLIEKRVSDLRDEAKYHVLSVDVESVRWRERLRTLDEVLGIPEEILMIGKAAKSEDV